MKTFVDDPKAKPINFTGVPGKTKPKASEPRLFPKEYGPYTISICGRDDNRVEARETGYWPYRFICEISSVYSDNDLRYGTGFFISPRAVVTAGHLVHSTEFGRWASHVYVTPALHRGGAPVLFQQSSKLDALQGWIKHHDTNYDLGCILMPDETLWNDCMKIMPRDDTNQSTWMFYDSPSDRAVLGSNLYTAGYPGDKPYGSVWGTSGLGATAVTETRFFYELDTAEGQSGSPIWLFDRGIPQVVGVVTTGGCPADKNGATRFSVAIRVDALDVWFNIR